MKTTQRNANSIILIGYLFIVLSIQVFVAANGQIEAPFVLCQLLVLTVLIVICPFLLQRIGCFSILVQEKADRRQGVTWGVLFFAAAFGILYYWYRAYYPGAFSAEAVEQYRQALSGVYNNRTPILQTWIAFTLPLKLTGRAASVVLFQIIEYSAVIAYMAYVLLRYGGKRIAILAFVYVLLNPVTGNVAVCPQSTTTFAIAAVLLMTFGLQIHMTEGKWLASKTAVWVMVLMAAVATLVSPYGILFTLPYLLAVLMRVDRKKKLKLLVLFVIGIDLIRGCLSYVNQDTEGTGSLDGRPEYANILEAFRMTDMVYAVDGNVDWTIHPEMAENDLGLEFQESEERELLGGYTEFSRSGILKYPFWCVGIVNLGIILAVLCKCKITEREDWKKVLYALPVLCYNFGIIFFSGGNDFKAFYMCFPVCPIIFMILFAEKAQENTREIAESANSQDSEGMQKRIPYPYAAAVLYALILFAINFSRVFNTNFWSDEGYSIMLSRMSFADMVNATAWDVHPPLYYILLQMICKAMGFQWVSYRLLSIIPYGLMLLFALTAVWKKLGRGPAILLITFSSLLYTSAEYNVQTRMYSWGALFVLMSFYFLHGIIMHNRIRDYVIFVFMSLGAAYTHYYCLISVAFFYLVLLVIAVVKRKEYLFRVLAACVITVLAYLPWFFILLQTFKRTSEGYWMTEVPSLKACMLYLFSSSCEGILLFIFLAAAIIFLLYETGMLRRKNEQTGRLLFGLGMSGCHISMESIWIAAGLFSILGTALTGIIVSEVFRPMFSVRYVYPVSAVAWLVFGLCFAKYREKTICAVIIVCLVLNSGISNYIEKYYSEEYEEERLETVLAATEGEIAEGDVILTDVALLDWTIINAYYPGISHLFIDENNIGILEENTGYWLFLGSEIDENREQMIAGQGYEAVCLVSDGNLGRIPVWVYKLNKA